MQKEEEGPLFRAAKKPKIIRKYREKIFKITGAIYRIPWNSEFGIGRR